jgi:hypothetical protein
MQIKSFPNFSIISLLGLCVFFHEKSAAQGFTEVVYVPELTGNYVVGRDNPFWNIPDGLNATLRETHVSFTWNYSSIPQFLTYEIAGVLQEPTPAVSEYLNEFAHPSAINFNGGFSFNPRPGIGWGTTLNENYTSSTTGGFFTIKQYDQNSGGFYFGAVIDVFSTYNSGVFAWQDSVIANGASLHAIFYNDSFTTNYTERGSVFIESARVGLATVFQMPGTVPMLRLQTATDYTNIPEPNTYGATMGVIGLVVVMLRRKRTTAGE